MKNRHYFYSLQNNNFFKKPLWNNKRMIFNWRQNSIIGNYWNAPTFQRFIYQKLSKPTVFSNNFRTDHRSESPFCGEIPHSHHQVTKNLTKAPSKNVFTDKQCWPVRNKQNEWQVGNSKAELLLNEGWRDTGYCYYYYLHWQTACSSTGLIISASFVKTGLLIVDVIKE